jgi:hypothetical protein
MVSLWIIPNWMSEQSLGGLLQARRHEPQKGHKGWMAMGIRIFTSEVHCIMWSRRHDPSGLIIGSGGSIIWLLSCFGWCCRDPLVRAERGGLIAGGGVACCEFFIPCWPGQARRFLVFIANPVARLQARAEARWTMRAPPPPHWHCSPGAHRTRLPRCQWRWVG